MRLVGSHLSRFGILGSSDEAATLLFEGENGIHVSTHVNFVNSDSYDYTIIIQGDKGTLVITPDRTESMHEQELLAYLCHGGETLATIEDGICNMELIGAALERTPNAAGAI